VTPSYHVDCMINGASAPRITKNTIRVGHEEVVVGGDCHAQNSLFQPIFPIFFSPVLKNLRVASSLQVCCQTFIKRAGSHRSSVRVVRFFHHRGIVSVVIISIAHETTVATVVQSGGAVYKLLFRQLEQGAVLDLIQRL